MVWWHVVLIVIGSYLMGNISVSRIIAGSLKQDITKLGSGNPGSTNIMRNFGLGMGVLNLILDMLKSIIPCLIVRLTLNNLVLVYISGLSCMLGHMFPVFFKFKGGKGIATMLGIFFVTTPITTSIVLVCAFFCWFFFKYGSVTSFFCITVLCVTEGIKSRSLGYNQCLVINLILFAIFVLTWWAHRNNINRLIIGNEGKVDIVESAKKKIKTKPSSK